MKQPRRTTTTMIIIFPEGQNLQDLDIIDRLEQKKGSGTANRTLSCSLEEIRDMQWDELVAAKTSYQKSDEYRLKQLLEANQPQQAGGGVTR